MMLKGERLSIFSFENFLKLIRNLLKNVSLLLIGMVNFGLL